MKWAQVDFRSLLGTLESLIGFLGVLVNLYHSHVAIFLAHHHAHRWRYRNEKQIIINRALKWKKTQIFQNAEFLCQIPNFVHGFSPLESANTSDYLVQMWYMAKIDNLCRWAESWRFLCSYLAEKFNGFQRNLIHSLSLSLSLSAGGWY